MGTDTGAKVQKCKGEYASIEYGVLSIGRGRRGQRPRGGSAGRLACCEAIYPMVDELDCWIVG